MLIDLKTLVLMNLLTSVVALISMGILWRQYRRRYRGITSWLVNMVFQAAAIVLLVFRGRIPDFASIVVANMSIQIGTLLIFTGIRKFLGHPRNQWHNIIILVLYFAAVVYSTFVVSDVNLRILLFSLCTVVLMAQIAWFLVFRAPQVKGYATRMTASIAAAYVAVNLLRIASHFIAPKSGQDFFQSAGFIETAVILVYMVLAMLLVLALVLMVNERLLNEIRDQEEKFSKAFHSAPYAVVLSRIDDGTIFEVNQSFENITGFTRAEAIHRTTSELRLWSSDEARKQFVSMLEETGKVRNMESEFKRKDGTAIVGIVSAETIHIGGEPSVIACIGDITEQSLLRDQLKELASRDALTGLPNRRLFYDRFGVALSNAVRSKNKLAVLSLDLDDFKEINDAHGHELGDMVLVEVARRLSGVLRQVDTVARFGGDEFVLLLWDIRIPEDALEVSEKIGNAFQMPFELSGRTLAVRVSTGIALYPDDGADLETLLRKSDSALYEVKRRGRNAFRLFGE